MGRPERDTSLIVAILGTIFLGSSSVVVNSQGRARIIDENGLCYRLCCQRTVAPERKYTGSPGTD
jgi:hypothetical protein